MQATNDLNTHMEYIYNWIMPKAMADMFPEVAVFIKWIMELALFRNKNLLKKENLQTYNQQLLNDLGEKIQ